MEEKWYYSFGKALSTFGFIPVLESGSTRHQVKSDHGYWMFQFSSLATQSTYLKSLKIHWVRYHLCIASPTAQNSAKALWLMCSRLPMSNLPSQTMLLLKAWLSSFLPQRSLPGQSPVLSTSPWQISTGRGWESLWNVLAQLEIVLLWVPLTMWLCNLLDFS
jgi:hypothetical protein